MAETPDQLARHRIATELRVNFLVEAGAGSGKTTSLSGRMVALVREGVAEADQIAAVTFTRKAAVELRERFQEDLERALGLATDPQVQDTLERALTRIDRTFLGTIHAFAARLLRERPLEAGLDPSFRELQENEEFELRGHFWSEWIERLAADGDADLLRLSDVGIRTSQLRQAFDQMVENLDLEFPAPSVEPPGPETIAPLRLALEALLDRAAVLLPKREPQKGWGDAQKKARRALHARLHRDWEDPNVFLDELRAYSSGNTTINMSRWEPDKKEQGPVKQLRNDIDAFTGDEGPVRPILAQWYAHRYPAAVHFVYRAAHAYAAERRRLGVVTFQDLLLLTADLLRRSPRTRRDLGTRFRHLLVDEFQDTDPVQAEIAFLLASDPTEEELTRGVSSSWHHVTPRPGALFVVGDPKQSIYRFRRADIAVYEHVRQRFQTFGEVLELDTNFRSVLPIAGMVNDVFSERFDKAKPPVQARYQSLLPQRPLPGEPETVMGVFHYVVDKKSEGYSEMGVRHEAERVAEWIHQRIARGERRPGDFLVLTRVKRNLWLFARALEERGLPLDVAGAGVGSAQQLDEVRDLLKALCDPGNEVLVVAALTGLFFGLDHEQLLAHRLAGGGFDPRESQPAGEVGESLRELGDWWQQAQQEPADVFLGWLVDHLGVYPHAAAGELGSIRTGVLTYALDAVRRAATAGDTSLISALAALDTALSWAEAEAPLRPGASDVVRLMNLHKAKGLEAAVVLLVDPGSGPRTGRSLRVERSEHGSGEGHFSLDVKEGTFGTIPLARPLEWERMKAAEDEAEAAEEDRLLYVAATRARDELVVAFGAHGTHPPWAVFEPWLREHSTQLPFPLGLDRRRPRLEASAEALAVHVVDARSRRDAAAQAGVRFATVTELAKGASTHEVPAVLPGAPPERVRGPRGYEWGSVVHAVLAAAARGVSGADLEALGRELLREYGRPTDERGEPRELKTLLELVARVHASDVWRRSEQGSDQQAEVPIASVLDDADRDARSETLLEGVIDLVFRGDSGWVVVDYKTDPGDDPDFPARSVRYKEQVRLYAAAWTRVVGEPVAEALVYYTTQQRVETA